MAKQASRTDRPDTYRAAAGASGAGVRHWNSGDHGRHSSGRDPVVAIVGVVDRCGGRVLR